MTMPLFCSNCNNSNPPKSQFCNKCGHQLAPKCTKCGNTNPVGALFCGKCGSKLDSSGRVPEITKAGSIEESIFEDNFLEYSSPEFDIKINYPATWTMTDNDLVDANTKVVFYSPREGPSDTYLDCLLVAIQEQWMMSLQSFIDGNLQNLRQTNPEFAIVDSFPTTLANLQHINSPALTTDTKHCVLQQ